MLAGPDIEILAFVPCVPGFNEFRIVGMANGQATSRPPRQYQYLPAA